MTKREQREAVFYAACDLVHNHMGVMIEVFIESSYWRRDHPDLSVADLDAIVAAAQALDLLARKVSDYKGA